MKALSIKQPWAWLIVNGHKSIENRDWNTNFRGMLSIHAGKSFDMEGYEWVKDKFPEIKMPLPHEFEKGGIVGHALITHTIHIRDKAYCTSRDFPWFFGEYGFVLANAKPCSLIPCKGTLGFFTPDFTSSYKKAGE